MKRERNEVMGITVASVEPSEPPVKESLTTERAERVLAKHQPCGCVVCDCEDDHQCQGCGAKSCGTHPVQEIPSPVYVEQERPEDGPVAWMLTHKDGSTNFEDCHDAVLFMQKHFDVSASPLYPASVKAERDALRERVKGLEALYSELLYQVAQKIPGETRHETALRQLRSANGPRDNPPGTAMQEGKS